ncbi:hypothetical protein Mapa_017093 [Marchantia paleacea]|nr:hypothetical protein Mapa_017093 [Marchantia paleacea]
MAITKSKVLIIGVTGYIGKNVCKASINLGHPTFILVRSLISADPAKAELINSFQESGVTALKGDLNDHESLVSAFRQVDVVISTVGGASLVDQIKILQAATEAGTIKRFFPSEFGIEVDRLDLEFKVADGLFGEKRKVRRAIEKSGIPYTYVAAGAFAGWFLATLCQENTRTPPRDKVTIWGDGNTRAILNDEDDIGTFTIKAIDDPRTKNRILIRPKENITSQNEAIALWEKKIGKTLEKTMVPKEDVFKLIHVQSPFPLNLPHAFRYYIFVKGAQTSFEFESNDVEATKLYPQVKYTTVSEYLDRFV